MPNRRPDQTPSLRCYLGCTAKRCAVAASCVYNHPEKQPTWVDPPELEIIETSVRVGDGKPWFVSRFRWRAEQERRRHERYRIVPSYRLEVVREGKRWAVVAFQNQARLLP